MKLKCKIAEFEGCLASQQAEKLAKGVLKRI